jgi:hypothetical membrane protein
MSLIPWWALLSSGAAPILLIGGWTAASVLQPTGFDPLSHTISALAADGATDRWLMTSVFAGIGVCYFVTAYGLKRVRPAGRVTLLLGGACSIAVAVFPEPGDGGTTPQHVVATGMGFATLAAWPCLAVEDGPSTPWPLRPAISAAFTALVLASAAWFLVELHGHGDAGVAERVVTGLQALWPVIVAAGLRYSAGQQGRDHPDGEAGQRGARQAPARREAVDGVRGQALGRGGDADHQERR